MFDNHDSNQRIMMSKHQLRDKVRSEVKAMRKSAYVKWASSRENLFQGNVTSSCSNPPAKLQRQARILDFCIKGAKLMFFSKSEHQMS